MSPPMDFGSSSQETVSSVEMEIQPRGAARCESRKTGPPGGVDFMCGLDDDSSQSGDNTVVSGKKRILRLVISDDEESPHDDNRQNNTDSDTDLPDI